MSRFLFFLLILSVSNWALAICEQPVLNQYILTTANPDFLLNKNLQKTQTHTFIYNHLKSNSIQKTSTNSSVQAQALKYSTLILNISGTEASKLRSHPDVVSLEQDCYVELSPLDLDETELKSPIDQDISIDSSTDVTPGDQIQRSEEDEVTAETINPNDSLFNYQWAFEASNSLIKPPTSVQTTLVAVSDTGFDVFHADLINNLWVNDLESSGRLNADNDKNGCRNDIHGCDTTRSIGDVGLNNFRSNYLDHGTHVAGIIGAEQNNLRGVYGVGNDVKLMLIKGFSSTRNTTASDLIKSVYYAVDNGAKLINCSWGVRSLPTMAEFLAFEYARLNDVLAIVAAGNENIYASSTSPAGLSNVLTVGSISSKKEISTFSNYGDAVDVYAPGGEKQRDNEFIYSTINGDRYEGKRGTSMAAPFVTGTLANIKSAYPYATRNELINLLLASAEQKSLRAYYQPSHREDARILDAGKLYALAKEYFESGNGELDFEPKPISAPPVNNGTYNSSSEAEFSTSSSGCSRNNNYTYSSTSLNTSKMSVSVFLFMIPLLTTVLIRIRHKKKAL